MSFTREWANEQVKKYSNLNLIDDSGAQFRLSLRSPDGILIWRDWNFSEDTSYLEKSIQEYGILAQDMTRLPHPYEKLVTYFGIDVYVNKQAKFLAADPDGMVWCYATRPDDESFGWVDGNGNFFRDIVMKVDLNGIDWKLTLVEVK